MWDSGAIEMENARLPPSDVAVKLRLFWHIGGYREGFEGDALNRQAFDLGRFQLVAEVQTSQNIPFTKNSNNAGIRDAFADAGTMQGSIHCQQSEPGCHSASTGYLLGKSFETVINGDR